MHYKLYTTIYDGHSFPTEAKIIIEGDLAKYINDNKTTDVTGDYIRISVVINWLKGHGYYANLTQYYFPVDMVPNAELDYDPKGFTYFTQNHGQGFLRIITKDSSLPYVDISSTSYIAIIATEELADIDDGLRHVKVPNMTKTFTNPVLYPDTPAHDYFPDPTVWQGDDGYFYATATSIGQHIYRSVDLVNWEDCGYKAFRPGALNAITGGGLDGHYTYNKIWSPNVVKIGNRWLMYVSLIKDNASPRRTAICVLESKKCCGPFDNPRILKSGSSSDEYPWNIDVIDPFVFNDGYYNYLFYGSSGGIYCFYLSEDGLTLGEPVFREGMGVPGRIAGKYSSSDPSRETVFEGSYVYRRGSTIYLFVSSGDTAQPNYKLRVGYIDLSSGDSLGSALQSGNTFIDFEGNQMADGYATTLLSGDEGPGHNGNIFTDALGKTYMFYHARMPGDTFGYDRAMHLQELKWTGDSIARPYFENNEIAYTEVYPYNVRYQNNSIGTSSVYMNDIIINASYTGTGGTLQGHIGFKVMSSYPLSKLTAERGTQYGKPILAKIYDALNTDVNLMSSLAIAASGYWYRNMQSSNVVYITDVFMIELYKTGSTVMANITGRDSRSSSSSSPVASHDVEEDLKLIGAEVTGVDIYSQSLDGFNSSGPVR